MKTIWKFASGFWFLALVTPALFDIGKQKPGYIFDAWTWIFGVAILFAAWGLGYLSGKDWE